MKVYTTESYPQEKNYTVNMAGLKMHMLILFIANIRETCNNNKLLS